MIQQKSSNPKLRVKDQKISLFGLHKVNLPEKTKVVRLVDKFFAGFYGAKKHITDTAFRITHNWTLPEPTESSPQLHIISFNYILILSNN